MLPSKTRTGLSETTPNKGSPATPRVSKLPKAAAKSDSNSSSPLQNPRLSMDHSPRSVDSKPAVERRLSKITPPMPAKSDSNSSSPLQNPQRSINQSPRSVNSKPAIERRLPKITPLTPAKSDSNSSSPMQNLRHSIDRSPRSVDSKPAFERRSPKITTPPDRSLKGSELQAQLGQVQEDLKMARDRLASVEKEKARALSELKEAKRLADNANEKLSEALVAQKRAEESSEIEKFRADELEQVGIEAAQKREEEWQKELDAIRNQHAVDVTALLSTTQELQRAKQELAMTSDAKKTALSHADDAMKIAEMNAEKVELLTGELSHLKALLDSKLETKSNETAELVQQLNSEVDSLKQELERVKAAEVKLAEMEAVIERLRMEVVDAKRAASDAGDLVNEWKKKVELLEAQIEEATWSERSASESLDSIIKQLEGNNVLLQDAESEIASLRGNVDSLEISVGRHKCDLEESDRRLEMAKREATEMTRALEILESELQSAKEEKAQALSNEMLASSSVQSLLEEKNKLINELEASRDEEEKNKKAMESLASALHEVSMEARDAKEKLLTNQADLGNAASQIEDLKSVLEATKKNYEAMLEEAKEDIDGLEKLVEKYRLEVKNSKAELEEKELSFVTTIKKSEEAIAALKGEKDRVAEDMKAEWNEKEISFMTCIKGSEEEKDAAKREVDRLVNLLKETKDQVRATKEDGGHLRNTLTQAESEASSAKEEEEKAKAERLQLKDRLLDRENELQSITQENDDLRAREAAAVEKAEELSKLLAEVTAKKVEENGKLSSSEKEYDLLPNTGDFKEENGYGRESEKPKSELPVEQQHEEHEKEDLSKGVGVVELKEENRNGNAKEDRSTRSEVKMFEKGMSPAKEPDPESFKDELASNTGSDILDQINGLPSEAMDNSRISPSKQQQKKKKTLLHKFGSLLKKKGSNSK
ncbi:WEB family protein At3g02930, chloroplastic-like isoform X2 [Magnolia sinica]|uniref:WEB family protein At3g02930, chloroplastic-like isoform X2 n=1 Tax=Magnolia sinica TaxID=86752 RepID=UPI0026595A9E|nr:WEB family protein At3g02930, chloroplastic-like isoform X2 [Magnolia sinica]